MLRKIFFTVKDSRRGRDKPSTSQPDDLIILLIHLIDLVFDLCIYYICCIDVFDKKIFYM